MNLVSRHIVQIDRAAMFVGSRNGLRHLAPIKQIFTFTGQGLEQIRQFRQG